MGKIYGIGETVLDIIFKNGSPQAAKPGGSVLNSLVSMGRIGLPVSFISEYGMDDVGDLINKFLTDNGVDTSLVHRFSDGNTSLAIAFLDNRNDAHYTFYKDLSKERLNAELPATGGSDILQFGSFYAIMPEIRKKIIDFVGKAKKKGTLILYDPNFRKAHIAELIKLKPFIIDNMKMASIVRGSDEDFHNIFGAVSADEAWETVSKYSNCLVYTSNAGGISVKTSSYSGRFPVRKIDPLSTIGAGDNFNAGIITTLYLKRINPESLEELSGREWDNIISLAVDFATEVCLSYDNYISHSFANKFISSNKIIND